MSNDLDDNKIHFTRRSGDQGYWSNENDSDDSSDDDSEDDCPTCFESIGEGLVHEMGNPGHGKRGSHAKNNRKVKDALEKMRQNPHHLRKEGVGESMMSD